MTELEKIIKNISEKLNVSMSYYAENTHPSDVPVCDKQFETIENDGTYTYFRFTFKNNGLRSSPLFFLRFLYLI